MLPFLEKKILEAEEEQAMHARVVTGPYAILPWFPQSATSRCLRHAIGVGGTEASAKPEHTV